MRAIGVEKRLESFRKAFSQELVALGEEEPDLVVLDADLQRSTGTRAFAERFPQRFINVGISEQDMVSTAAGLAIAGKKPLASTFAVFLLRAWEQIRNTVARDRLNVKLVGTHAGLSPIGDGASHQALEDVAALRGIPGMTIVSPADAEATRVLLRHLVKSHRGPAYMRLGRDNAIPVYTGEEARLLRLGEPQVVVEGGDVVLFATGPMVGVAVMASKLLGEAGIGAGVVDVHTLKPLSPRVVDMARGTALAVSLEEHNVIGGLGSALAEAFSANPRSVPPLLRLGVVERFGTAARDYWEVLEFFRLTPRWVAKRVLEEVRGGNGS